MVPPPIQLFLTTIASQPALRQRQEYILRSLQVKKIPYTSFDLASDEAAKRLWKRKAPLDKQQLPGILVDGKFVGTFTQFEEAVEFNELAIFLRQNEEWTPPEDDTRGLVVKPIGVPGAYEPLQMFPKHAPSRSPSPNPMSLREKEKKELDVSDQLGEFGLEGVSVSADDLRALIEELGLGGDDAKDLVKGLGGDVPENKPEPTKQEAQKETAADTKSRPLKQTKKEAPADTKPRPAKEVQKVTTTEEKSKDVKDIEPTPEIKVQLEDVETEPTEDANEKGAKTEVTKAATTESSTTEVVAAEATIPTAATTAAAAPIAPAAEATTTTQEKSA